MAEVFQAGTGALVRPGSAEALRSALEPFVGSDALRAEAGRRGLEAAPLFGWDRVPRTTVGVCERVLAARRP